MRLLRRLRALFAAKPAHTNGPNPSDLTSSPVRRAAREQLPAEMGFVCPIHGISDCSPLLNGCSLVIQMHNDARAREHIAHWDTVSAPCGCAVGHDHRAAETIIDFSEPTGARS